MELGMDEVYKLLTEKGVDYRALGIAHRFNSAKNRICLELSTLRQKLTTKKSL